MKPEEIAALLVEKFGAKNPGIEKRRTAPIERGGSCGDSGGLPFRPLRRAPADGSPGAVWAESITRTGSKSSISLYSMKHHHRYTLKCRLPRENPAVHTVESVWGVANWHEREAFDMFGIVFEGHSDLRRILCPDDWEGYPLRKDYKFPKSYRDMPV